MTAFNKSIVVLMIMLTLQQQNTYIISNVIQHNGHALYTTRWIATVLFRVIFRIMLLNIPAIALFLGVSCTTGLAVFAFFALSGCDPLANRDVQNPNQVHNN